jgi:DNA-binding transcriptional regulator YiaG
MNEDIKEARQRLDLTQAEFGDRLGVTGRTVARWEAEPETVPLTVKMAVRELQRQEGLQV